MLGQGLWWRLKQGAAAVRIWTNHEQSALVAEGCALKGYISRAVFFMYPYVFAAGPNNHDVLPVNGTRNWTAANAMDRKKRLYHRQHLAILDPTSAQTGQVRAVLSRRLCCSSFGKLNPEK
jgi:uncharacterized protein YfaP (DUF2135 family)